MVRGMMLNWEMRGLHRCVGSDDSQHDQAGGQSLFADGSIIAEARSIGGIGDIKAIHQPPGSLPGGTLPTRLVAIGSEGKKKGRNIAQALGRGLRSQQVPVIGRINDDVLLLDPRSVLPEEDVTVLELLRNLASGLKT